MNLTELVSSSHQSIKIVPSIEDSLQKMGLDVKLSKSVSLWFDKLQKTWNTWKKSPTVDNHFATLYTFEDPYRIVLVCIIKCDESKNCNPKSLPYFMMESLQKWAQINKNIPDDNLKLPAFHIATMQRNQQFLFKVAQTYNLKSINDKILPLVKNMIKNDNCKEASQIVSALELCDEIPIEDLLFPLILQDKINVIDEYLTDSPGQVRPLLTFLDSLLDKKYDIRNYVQRFLEDHQVYNIKYNKLHYKPLGKLVARLCTKYNVPIETCKNLSKNRTSGGLRYLIYQKYVEHNISASVWDDLVKDSLNQTEGCAEEFIKMLVEYDPHEALKWAKYLNITENDLPLALKNLSIQDNTIEEESWDDTESAAIKYYELPIDNKSIIMIDTQEKFYDIFCVLEKCNLVSIDCEWKPSFGATQSQVALLQIATPTCIYLIDTLLFGEKQHASFWYKFNKSLLDNDEIIKLGFGLEQDLKEMKASIIGLNNIKIKGEGLLDLSVLWKCLIESGLFIPNSSGIAGQGLSSLVEICFGVPLKKTEQCSNWELRPLRSTQVYYAAVDAYVLLDIYKYLQKLCEQQKINFEEMCNEVMSDKKPTYVKKPKGVSKLNTPCIIIKSPKEVNILVEPDLSYLMGYLRHCGIDTVSVSSSMQWNDTIDFALSEDRNILTSKMKLSYSLKYPQSSILNLCKRTTIKDQIQKILCTFHIVITQADLFKRCIYCNGIELRNLNFDELTEIYNKYKTHGDTNTAYNNYSSENYDDDPLDDFLSESDEDEKYTYHYVTPQRNQNKVCVTSKGAVIDLSNIEQLLSYYQSHKDKTAILCDSCGKFYWDEDETIKCISSIVTQFVNFGT